MIGSLLSNLFGNRYTLGELMQIDGNRQARAGNCSVSLVDTFFSLKEEGIAAKVKKFFTNMDTVKIYYITLKLAVKSDTGNPHYVFIQLEPDFSLNNWSENKIRVYCDCADFKFRSAYILDKRDSLFKNERIKISLGQALSDAPKGNKGVTLLCKHAFAAINWVMNNYTNIMNSL